MNRRAFVVVSVLLAACTATPADQEALNRPGPSAVPSDGSPSVVPTEESDAGKASRNPPKGAPRKAVAISDDGRLVLLDARSGEEIRVLWTSPRKTTSGYLPIQSLALSPDRKDVYFTKVRQNSGQAILRVPVSGGRPERITAGAAPSVSPDGKSLAFSVPRDLGWWKRHRRQQVNFNANSIGVLQLETGEVQAWRLDEDEEDFFQTQGHIYATTWSPDGTHIAYHFCYEGCEVRILDLDETSLSTSRALRVGEWPSWISGSTLVTAETCCFPYYDKEKGRVVLIDTRTGKVRREIPTGEEVARADPDRSGRFFIVALVDGSVEVATAGRAPFHLSSGYVAAVW
jgi:WD40 repeat protein